MFSSEQKFTINGSHKDALRRVLELGLKLSGYKTIEAFYEDSNGLVLCSYECAGSAKYPFEATVPVLVEHINQYIQKLSSADIERLAGAEPSIDGGCVLGWEVFHPLWCGENKLENYRAAAILAVRPCWIMFAK